jgi:hypothetical protein
MNKWLVGSGLVCLCLVWLDTCNVNCWLKNANSQPFAENYKPINVQKAKDKTYEEAFDRGYLRAYQVVKRDIPVRRYIIEKRSRAANEIRTEGERGFTDGLIFGFRSMDD